MNPLPTPLAPLVELPNWVIWRWEISKQGKRTKVPYQARHPQSKAATNNPSTWATYDEAVVAAGSADGIGFVLTNTEFAAFDIDNCRNVHTGEIHPWAVDLIAQAASYAEITISGTGVRIIGEGSRETGNGVGGVKGGAEGNASQQSTHRAQYRRRVSKALERVRQVAVRTRGGSRMREIRSYGSVRGGR